MSFGSVGFHETKPCATKRTVLAPDDAEDAGERDDAGADELEAHGEPAVGGNVDVVGLLLVRRCVGVGVMGGLGEGRTMLSASSVLPIIYNIHAMHTWRL